jgi:hypothetical protein
VYKPGGGICLALLRGKGDGKREKGEKCGKQKQPDKSLTISM